MTSDYTKDVVFNSAFDALQTPVHMFTAATLCGAPAADITKPFRYLDLACGNGFTITLLADVYRHAQFVGVDINPEHIASAKAFAERAQLENVSFYEGDLGTLEPGTHGAFDYCAASGVYSWIDAPRRAATRALFASSVLGGGLVYLDYSAQPGMAQNAPLYRMIRDRAKNLKGTSAERLAQAAAQISAMAQDGARFFQANPLAKERLDVILKNPPEDEAHEIFNLQDGGLWSGDVISDMADAGFTFVANAGLHHNLPQLSSNPAAMETLLALPKQDAQSQFDIVWNVHQRRDIYTKGSPGQQSQNLISVLGSLPLFKRPGALEEDQRRHLAKSIPHFDFCSAQADEFASAAKQASTFGALTDALRSAGMPQNDIVSLTRHFLAAQLIGVGVSEPYSFVQATTYEMPSKFNQIILKDDIGRLQGRPFASPVAGSRIELPLKERLYLWALLGMEMGTAWDQLGDLQDAFRGNDQQPLSRQGFIQIIASSLPSFQTHIVPELVGMGLLRAKREQT